MSHKLPTCPRCKQNNWKSGDVYWGGMTQENQHCAICEHRGAFFRLNGVNFFVFLDISPKQDEPAEIALYINDILLPAVRKSPAFRIPPLPPNKPKDLIVYFQDPIREKWEEAQITETDDVPVQ